MNVEWGIWCPIRGITDHPRSILGTVAAVGKQNHQRERSGAQATVVARLRFIMLLWLKKLIEGLQSFIRTLVFDSPSDAVTCCCEGALRC